MRSVVRFFLFASLASSIGASAQEKGVLAEFLLQKMTNAAGWTPTAIPHDVVIFGELTRAVDNRESVTFKVRGPRLYRFESQSGAVSIVNDSSAFVRTRAGKRRSFIARPFQMSFLGLPFLSEIPRASFVDYETTYLGAELLGGQNCDVLLIEPRSKVQNPSKDLQRIAGRVKVWISRNSSLLMQAEFVHLMDTNPTVSLHVQVRYSDYRSIDGVAVPFRFEEFMEGRSEYKFQASEVKFNVGLSSEEFALASEEN